MPAYRVPFLVRLRTSLAEQGIELHVAFGEPVGNIRARGDNEYPDWMTRLPTRSIPLGSHRRIIWRNTRKLLHDVSPDFVITEQAIKNLENYWLLWLAKMGRFEFAFWGHGRSYSTPQTASEAKVKDWLTNRAGWFFAYTAGGVDHVVSHGFNRNRVTEVRNSIDTDELKLNLGRVSEASKFAFLEEHGCTAGYTCLYLGGVDEEKGIPWLLQTAELIAAAEPKFRLLIGGTGNLSDAVVAAATTQNHLVPLGRLDGIEKARALAASDLLLVPFWVGLVAVDSLTSGVPIVTTESSTHSPEYEYLDPGRTCIQSQCDQLAYRDSVIELLHNTSRRADMSASCFSASAAISIDAMVQNFASGAVQWMQAS